MGPRVLTAGLHVNGPNGYVTAGLGAHVDAATRNETAIELWEATLNPRGCLTISRTDFEYSVA